MIRILLSSIILALGISGAAFAFKNIDNPLASIPDRTTEIKSNNKVDLNQPFKQAEKPLASASQSASDSKTEIPTDSSQNSGNLTDLFVQKIKNEILQNNPQGPSTIGGKSQIQVPDTEELTTNFINEAQAEFNIQDFIPEIKDGDLKISKNNTKEAFIEYGQKFDQIVEDGKISEIPDPQKNNDLSVLDTTIENYSNAIEKFYNLTVPELMAGIHKTEIQYLTAELKIMEKIKNYQNDPVSAMLAGQNFSEIEKEFQSRLSEQMQKFLKIVGAKN